MLLQHACHDQHGDACPDQEAETEHDQTLYGDGGVMSVTDAAGSASLYLDLVKSFSGGRTRYSFGYLPLAFGQHDIWYAQRARGWRDAHEHQHYRAVGAHLATGAQEHVRDALPVDGQEDRAPYSRICRGKSCLFIAGYAAR